MSQSNRRSFYFNEENQDLFNFLKTKRRANEWVMDTIRRAMVLELGGGVVHPATTPSQSQIDYQALVQRIQLLESQSQPIQQVSLIQPLVVEETVQTPPVVPTTSSVVSHAKPEPEPMPQPTSSPSVVKMNYQINKPQPEKPVAEPVAEVDPFSNFGNLI